MKNRIILFFTYLIILSFLVSCRESITDPVTEDINDIETIVVSLKEIKNPTDRVSWNTGESYSIEWTITQNIDNIRIVLLKKFVEVAIIEKLTKNDGTHIWTIPSDLPPSHHYRIRLTSPYYHSVSSTSVEFEIIDQH